MTIEEIIPRPDDERIWADAGDEGFRFIFGNDRVGSFEVPQGSGAHSRSAGGILRVATNGHLATIVGRGGTGKSILALQIINHLLRAGRRSVPAEYLRSAAFYFTLEASPLELLEQSRLFRWRMSPSSAGGDLVVKAPLRSSGRLAIVPIPSPTEDFTSVVLQIKQTISQHLDQFDELAAIVIDPLGGITLGQDLRSELNQLKELAESHQTLVVLLAEDYVYNLHRTIEHYSQTIVHLEHDPLTQPSRRLHIQKARNQPFRSGYHQFDINHASGIQVFPSVQSQSAFAHEELDRALAGKQRDGEEIDLLALGDEQLRGRRDSVVFLMGPPGTFKQYLAAQFCLGGEVQDSAIYISFKADEDAVRRQITKVEKDTKIYAMEELLKDSYSGKIAAPRSIWFRNARNPLLTPEEILSEVRTVIGRLGQDATVRRAVVWGLRRLADMPHFGGGTAVQFLEALVTLLRARNIATLLVDWPDVQRPSTLPIVDLSQHILFTRVCRGRDELNDEHCRERVWSGDRHHVALVRVQRDDKGYHRNKGAICFKHAEGAGQERTVIKQIEADSFEATWMTAGVRWEQDHDLGDHSSLEGRLRAPA